jgi:hypothetical protein
VSVFGEDYKIADKTVDQYHKRPFGNPVIQGINGAMYLNKRIAKKNLEKEFRKTAFKNYW